MCRGWRWCGRTRRSRPPSRRGGDVIAMVLKAATREVESHPLASGDHGDGVGGGGPRRREWGWCRSHRGMP
jgi:hypothetical protein